MYSVLKLALAFCCIGMSATREIPPNYLLRNTEMNLLQLMVETRLEQRANPEQSLACFNYYLPLFDSLNIEYKENYAACLSKADVDRSEIDDSTQPQRDLIENSAKTSCVALKDCAELKGSINYFSCFTDSGKENTATMYEISANASETLAKVQELYRLIEISEYRCTNASERVYTEKTYQANLDLQSCLRGDIVPPTTAPNTQAPDTTTAATEPTTEASELTTASVELSTEAHGSTTVSEDPSTEASESTTAWVGPTSQV